MPRWFGIALFLLLAGLMIALLDRALGLGADWHYFFYAIPKRYLAGETILYDAWSYGWYNPPWLLPLLFPFTLLPESTGLLIYRLLGLATAAVAALTFTPKGQVKPVIVGLSLASLAVWDSLISGNVDVIVLLGLVGVYWGLRREQYVLIGVGIVLALVKPQLGLPPITLALLSPGVKPRRLLIQAGPILLGAIILSVLLSGLDWPLRYIAALNDLRPTEPYNISLFKTGQEYVSLSVSLLALSLPVLGLVALALHSGRRSPDLANHLALGVSLTPLISPYYTSTSLLLPAVMAWPLVARRCTPFVSGAIYLLPWLIVARGPFGWETGRFVILFPLALTLALVWQSFRNSREVVTQTEEGPA